MKFLSLSSGEREMREIKVTKFFLCLIRWRYRKLNYFQKFWYFFSKNVSYISINFLYIFEFFLLCIFLNNFEFF